MLAVVVLGLTLAVGASRLGAAVVAQARADTAADAAALAAADMLALGRGAGAARAAAHQTARANGATLERCDCEGIQADVEVRLPATGLLGAAAVGHARAEVGLTE